MKIYKHREKISFGIQLISFIGSLLFVLYAWFFSTPRNPENDCFRKMIYYQQQNDSLRQVIKNIDTAFHVPPTSR